MELFEKLKENIFRNKYFKIKIKGGKTHEKKVSSLRISGGHGPVLIDGGRTMVNWKRKKKSEND
jgi:hypothetical protein